MSEEVDRLLDILGREDVREALEYRSKYLIDGQLAITPKDYAVIRTWIDEHATHALPPKPSLYDINLVVLKEGGQLVGAERVAFHSPLGYIVTMPKEPVWQHPSWGPPLPQPKETNDSADGP